VPPLAGLASTLLLPTSDVVTTVFLQADSTKREQMKIPDNFFIGMDFK